MIKQSLFTVRNAKLLLWKLESNITLSVSTFIINLLGGDEKFEFRTPSIRDISIESPQLIVPISN